MAMLALRRCDRRWVVVLARGRDAGLVRAAGQDGAQGLPARERRGAVRDQRAHARGHQPGGDRSSPPSASRATSASGPRWRRRWSPSATTSRRRRTWRRSTCGWSTPTSASVSQDELQDKRAQARSLPKLPQGATASPCRRSPAFGGGAFSTATVQYILTGPDLEQLEQYARRRSSTKLKAIPGAVDVDTHARRPASRSSVATSTGAGRRPRRQRRRTSR